MRWISLGVAFLIVAGGVFAVCLVLGGRMALGIDDPVLNGMAVLLKGEVRGPFVDQLPRWTWFPLFVVLVILVHLFVLLPLFAGYWVVVNIVGENEPLPPR